MTSGTTYRDNTVGYDTPSGRAKRGVYFERTWNGTDSLPSRSGAPLPAPYPRRIRAFGPGLEQFEASFTDPPYAARKRYVSKPPKRASLGENPYSCTIRDTYMDFYEARNNENQGYAVNRYGYDCYLLPNSAWTSNDDIALYGRLRNAVAGSDFNLAVAAAESREALNAITDAASRIYWSYRAMKHGDIFSAQRILLKGNDRAAVGWVNSKDGTKRSVFQHTLADNWLSLQYGWLPLLADAKAAAEFIAHRNFYPHQKVVRASLKVGHPMAWGGTGNALPTNFTGFTQKKIKAILAENPSVTSLSGLTDPLSVAWEVVPYSFVADWFVPIGDYLSARGLSSALTGTFVTTSFNISAFSGLHGGIQGEYGRSDAKPPANLVRDKYVTVSRTVSNSLNVPLPSLKPLGQALSWKRAVSSVALLTSVIR